MTAPAHTTCSLCNKRIRTRYRLYDCSGEVCGEYCSKSCADNDAWGPRFRPYKVRKMPERRA